MKLLELSQREVQRTKLPTPWTLRGCHPTLSICNNSSQEGTEERIPWSNSWCAVVLQSVPLSIDSATLSEERAEVLNELIIEKFPSSRGYGEGVCASILSALKISGTSIRILMEFLSWVRIIERKCFFTMIQLGTALVKSVRGITQPAANLGTNPKIE